MKLVLLRLIIPLLLLALWIGCANIQTPTGGPKDKRPPKVTLSIPTPNQTQFKGKTVVLVFNEAIKLNNPKEEIIISPSPGKDIEFQTKGNRVMITPKEPWKDTTTYSIVFREGVQDITESNSPTNLKLAFSTGPSIDSMMMSGTVFDLLTGIPQEKATVAIYESDTFNLFNHAPTYFTKADKKGNFKLENLRTGNYKLYAFDDKNKNLKVESRSEKYGFLPSKFSLQENIDSFRIGLIQLDSRPIKLSNIRNIGNVTRVRFSKALVDYSLTSDKEVVHAFGDNQSEIAIWNPETDSARIQLLATDSLENSVDSIFYIKKTSIKPVIDKFIFNIGSPFINPENARLVNTFKFSKPITQQTLDSIFIQVDTTSRITFTKDDLIYDAKHKEMTLNKALEKKMFGANQNPILNLVVRKGFGLSVEQDTTKVSSIPIRIYWPEESGTISLQANTKQKGYVIQLLDKASKTVAAQAVSTPKLTARNIPPGEYQIRIIIDTNQNGKWDCGNIKKDIPPETIVYYKAPDGATSFQIRANWEVGPIQLHF